MSAHSFQQVSPERQSGSARRPRLGKRTRLAVAAAAVVAACRVVPALAHVDPFEVRATAQGAGRLTIDRTSADVEMALVSCDASECLYRNEELSFVAPPTDDGPLHNLKSGTTVSFELTAVDAGVTIAIEEDVLEAPHESEALGKAWSMHGHAAPAVRAPPGDGSPRSLTFVLTSETDGYETSEPITLTLVLPAAASTTTTTLGATDCGNGIVEAGEDCDAGPGAWSPGRSCDDTCGRLDCGDADGSGARTASDALFVLRVATGAAACDACLCDTDGGGAAAAQVSASDALRLLRFAVGSPGAELDCATCQ